MTSRPGTTITRLGAAPCACSTKSSQASASVSIASFDAPWPKVDEAALVQDEIELMLQVNGKLRGAVRVPAGASKEEIEKLAVASEAFAQHSGGAAPKKVIVVPGRLVNVVI